MTETPKKNIVTGIVEFIEKTGIQGLDPYRFAYDMECLFENIDENEWDEEAKDYTVKGLNMKYAFQLYEIDIKGKFLVDNQPMIAMRITFADRTYLDTEYDWSNRKLYFPIFPRYAEVLTTVEAKLKEIGVPINMIIPPMPY